jgi:hypothetical protein
MSSLGEHSQDPEDLLQGQGLPQAHPAQGHRVQGWQGAHTSVSRPRTIRGPLTTKPGLALRARKETLRPQAVRIRWSDQARLPQEGQDNEEGRVEIGMRQLQD